MVMWSRWNQRNTSREYIQTRQAGCDIYETYCESWKGGFEEKKYAVLYFFKINRWPPGFRNRWPSGPPTSETRWPFKKSGGQWPPGHREFRALSLSIYHVNMCLQFPIYLSLFILIKMYMYLIKERYHTNVSVI